ncbi:MAG: hypothetical protein QNK37_35715 [Acidobacteriota bacterium]|nr:hypothetical protein [Acidobacteriota bacterium]
MLAPSFPDSTQRSIVTALARAGERCGMKKRGPAYPASEWRRLAEYRSHKDETVDIPDIAVPKRLQRVEGNWQAARKFSYIQRLVVALESWRSVVAFHKLGTFHGCVLDRFLVHEKTWKLKRSDVLDAGNDDGLILHDMAHYLAILFDLCSELSGEPIKPILSRDRGYYDSITGEGALPEHQQVCSRFLGVPALLVSELEKQDLAAIPKQYEVRCVLEPPEQGVYRLFHRTFGRTVVMKRKQVGFTLGNAPTLQHPNVVRVLEDLPEHLLLEDVPGFHAGHESLQGLSRTSKLALCRDWFAGLDALGLHGNIHSGNCIASKSTRKSRGVLIGIGQKSYEALQDQGRDVSALADVCFDLLVKQVKAPKRFIQLPVPIGRLVMLAGEHRFWRRCRDSDASKRPTAGEMVQRLNKRIEKPRRFRWKVGALGFALVSLAAFGWYVQESDPRHIAQELAEAKNWSALRVMLQELPSGIGQDQIATLLKGAPVIPFNYTEVSGFDFQRGVIFQADREIPIGSHVHISRKTPFKRRSTIGVILRLSARYNVPLVTLATGEVIPFPMMFRQGLPWAPDERLDKRFDYGDE